MVDFALREAYKVSAMMPPPPRRPSRGRRPRAPLMALPYPILRGMSRLRYAALRVDHSTINRWVL